MDKGHTHTHTFPLNNSDNKIVTNIYYSLCTKHCESTLCTSSYLFPITLCCSYYYNAHFLDVKQAKR